MAASRHRPKARSARPPISRGPCGSPIAIGLRPDLRNRVAYVLWVSPIGIDLCIRIVIYISKKSESLTSVRIGNYRIDRQEPPRNGIVVPLLHVHEICLGILHMPCESDDAGAGARLGTSRHIAIRLEAAAVQHRLAAVRVCHRASQRIGVHILRHPFAGLGDLFTSQIDVGGSPFRSQALRPTQRATAAAVARCRARGGRMRTGAAAQAVTRIAAVAADACRVGAADDLRTGAAAETVAGIAAVPGRRRAVAAAGRVRTGAAAQAVAGIAAVACHGARVGARRRVRASAAAEAVARIAAVARHAARVGARRRVRAGAAAETVARVAAVARRRACISGRAQALCAAQGTGAAAVARGGRLAAATGALAAVERAAARARIGHLGGEIAGVDLS